MVVLGTWFGAKVNLQRCSQSSPQRNNCLVVLFGWMLARDKNLLKYANLFDDVDTIRVTAPLHVMANRSRCTQFASKFLQLIVHGAECKGKEKVVMIFFSNNGSLVLERLNSISRYSKDRDIQRFFNHRLRACVLDSCPGELSMRLGINAIASSLKPTTFLARHAATLTKAFVVTCWLFLLLLTSRRVFPAHTLWQRYSKSRSGHPSVISVLSFVTILSLPLIVKVGERRHTLRYWHSITSMDGIPSPWLVVYGDADDLVLPHHVRHVIQLRRRNGGHVDSLCFPGSPHVQHLRTNPHKYKSVVTSFVAKHLLTLLPVFSVR